MVECRLRSSWKAVAGRLLLVAEDRPGEAALGGDIAPASARLLGSRVR